MSVEKKLLSESLLPKSTLELIASHFQALAHPSRLHLLNCLCRNDTGVGVSELALQTELSIANVSRQLALLARHGLVKKAVQGNSAIYTIADSSIHDMCRLVCANIGKKLIEESDANNVFLNQKERVL